MLRNDVVKSKNAAHEHDLVGQFAAPDVDTIDGVQIKRLPAGEALGARDLTRWSSNRSGGQSGSYTTKREREILDNWTKPAKAKKELRGRSASAHQAGVTIEEIADVGWLINFPDGRTIGTFETRDEALRYVETVGRY